MRADLVASSKGSLPFMEKNLVFVLTAILINSISSGMMLTFPSILNPALLSKNATDIKATVEQVSWITTSNGIAGTFGFFVLSTVLQIFGRKVVYILTNFLLFAGWIIFALAHSITALMVARIVHGLSLGAFFLQWMIISEYTHPKRRGYFVTSKKTALAVGAVLCHTLAIPLSWQQIATFGIFLSALAMIMVLFWPESPYYLSMKGHFEESEKSFVWLHGGANMHELHLLHSTQHQKETKPSTKVWYKFLIKEDFLKPFVIVLILTQVQELCGNHYVLVYIIQIMIDLTGVKSFATYFSIGADIIRTTAAIMACFIIVRLNRRTILFSFGFTTAALMLFICIVVVFQWPKTPWLVPVLIALQVFVAHISVIPICFTFFGEIYPLEHKGWGSCLNGIVFTCSYTFLLKLTPVLLGSTGVGGMYGIYAIAMTIGLLVLFYIVPETKDRTLQEIENDICNVELSNLTKLSVKDIN